MIGKKGEGKEGTREKWPGNFAKEKQAKVILIKVKNGP